jgi:hypothetical protein
MIIESVKIVLKNDKQSDSTNLEDEDVNIQQLMELN